MADVAQDVSGPGSPAPAAIPPRQASRTEADRGKLRVFISYSRDDLDFADQLKAALDTCGFECVLDRHGISGGEAWRRRLGHLIAEADTVVFVLSPHSARSETCAWEVEEAARLGKRILPVNCRPLGGTSPPPRLRDLNYIFFHAAPKAPGAGFGTGLAALVAALNTDVDWLREHTRYLQRATEWDWGRRPANRLLSGNDILEAKAWVARRPNTAPEPTALQLDFIRASEEEAEARSSAERRQLAAIAAAQADRERALHEAEGALKQAADAQRKRARIRNIALAAVSIFLVLAIFLYRRAEHQREVAEAQRTQAGEILSAATDIIVKFEHQIDAATSKQVYAVFQAGAEHGDPTATRNLGLAYSKGLGVAQNDTKAREWYEKAAAMGSTSAMRNLGELYHNGHGVAQDYVKAREWYEKAAADKSEARAMTNLGLLYHNGHGVAQDYAKAREWYEKAADGANTSGMVHLGLLYANAQGVAQDYDRAREWYERAAEKGEASAMVHLGVLYDNGHGVAQDYTRAREWYERAADKGDASAMANLGLLHANAEGVAQDYAKAREWYEKAADKGNARAMANLGLLHNNGQGVVQDYAKAREWYEKAADKGDASAMANLGALYHDGHGVARDYDKAREWYEKAAHKGQTAAMGLLEKLAIHEAAAAGRYTEALQLQEAVEAKEEAAETKREGKPGKETATALNETAWHALFAQNFTKALAVGNRAHGLLPEDLPIETNRAHALMFLGRAKESRALYLAHMGKPLSGQNPMLWQHVIADDFAQLRKAGLAHPMMTEIEKQLGISVEDDQQRGRH